MGINIGGILGGIAGVLTGGGSFLAPAIGAGLGTLAGGGSAKNAIKYALLGGGASALGLGSMIQDSAFGKAAMGKMGTLFGAAGTAPGRGQQGQGQQRQCQQRQHRQVYFPAKRFLILSCRLLFLGRC